jgi:ribonuclease VapC
MFVDASAIVAILLDEPDAPRLSAALSVSGRSPLYSSLVVYEAVVSLARKISISRFGEQRPTPRDICEAVELKVDAFLTAIGASEMPLGAGLHGLALDAARRYGRGTGHPARLNFGDCFAYACARSAGVPLLFTGEDFRLTDIEAA